MVFVKCLFEFMESIFTISQKETFLLLGFIFATGSCQKKFAEFISVISSCQKKLEFNFLRCYWYLTEKIRGI